MSTFDKKKYEEVLIDLLPSQFKENITIKGILESVGLEMNKTQDEILSVLGVFSLGQAEGHTLDTIGKNLGVYRNGSSDEDYRKRIQIEIASNVSKGTASDLINISKTYSNSEFIELIEYGAMGSLIQINNFEGDQNLVDILNKAAPAGGSVFVQSDADGYSTIPVEEGETVSNTSGVLAEVDESFDLLQTDTSDIGNLIVNEDNLVSQDDNLYYQGELVEYSVMVVQGVEYFDIIYAGTASDSFPAPVEVHYK